MSNFLLLLILFVLASVLLLIVYLIDRVNIIEKVTMGITGPKVANENGKVGVFGELTGESLWTAMSGNPTTNWDITALNEIKPRYEVVLQKHIEALFEDGTLDGREGITKTPRNSHNVSTLRGAVESWIPQEYAQALYQLGVDRAHAVETDLEVLKTKIDDACKQIFSHVGIEAKRPISQILIPVVTQEVTAGNHTAIPEENNQTAASQVTEPTNAGETPEKIEAESPGKIEENHKNNSPEPEKVS